MYQRSLHEEGIPLDQVAGILQPFGLGLLMRHGPFVLLCSIRKATLSQHFSTQELGTWNPLQDSPVPHSFTCDCEDVQNWQFASTSQELAPYPSDTVLTIFRGSVGAKTLYSTFHRNVCYSTLTITQLCFTLLCQLSAPRCLGRWNAPPGQVHSPTWTLSLGTSMRCLRCHEHCTAATLYPLLWLVAFFGYI